MQRLMTFLLHDFNKLWSTWFDDTFKRQGLRVEVFSILFISTWGKGCGLYSIGVVGVGSSVGVGGLADIEAPEDARYSDEQGLFSDLLAGTDSPAPAKRRVSLLIGVCEVSLEVSIGIERMRIRVIFGIVIYLMSTFE